MEVAKHYLDQFMLESNAIEGERGLNPYDYRMAKKVCENGITSLEALKNTHAMLTKHLSVDWSGKWRTVDVQVGSYIAPGWASVPELMAQFTKQLPDMDSWEAHNAFEKIHPFRDFNGRMGRLIWLSKAINEKHRFVIPFLQAYYYQTLSHLN